MEEEQEVYFIKFNTYKGCYIGAFSFEEAIIKFKKKYNDSIILTITREPFTSVIT